MRTHLLQHIASYMSAGGTFMIALLLMGITLWTLIILRIFTLQQGWSGPLNALLHDPSLAKLNGVLPRVVAGAQRVLRAPSRSSRRLLELEIERHRQRLSRYARGIDTITVTAPMMGLMGTVAGMIQTFHVLTHASAAPPEQLARGISIALITTEFGLAIAIPGLIAGRLLQRREQTLSQRLDELATLLWNAQQLPSSTPHQERS